MQTTQRKIVVGVFEDHRHAQKAVDELKRNGFTDDQIGVVSRDAEGFSSTITDDKGSSAAAGAATGAAAGAGVGALWALGIAAGFLPAIGPVIAGGLFASILASAAGGAAVAGIVGALIGMGIPEEDAEYYEGEVKGGRTLVTVQAETRYNEALVIIQRHGGYDRSSQQTSTSTTAKTQGAFCPTGTSQTTSTGQTATSGQTARTVAGAGQTFQLHEEQLNVHKQPVQTGEVRVRKEVITEHKTIEVPVQREEVVIERHAVSGQSARSADIRAGEEIRIPVKEEKIRVEKQAVVTEEVTVGKRQVQDTEHVSGTVRKEKVHVEQEGDVNVKGSNAGDTKSRGKR